MVPLGTENAGPLELSSQISYLPSQDNILSVDTHCSWQPSGVALKTLWICQNIDFWRPSSSLMTSRVFCAVVMTMTMSMCFYRKSRVGVMASLHSVVLASFIAQVKSVMFYDFFVSGAGWGDSVYLVHAPYNPYDCNCLDVRCARADPTRWVT